MSGVPPVQPLRGRRRRQTARDIHLVALRLARQRGFGAVTVDEISAEAGVARRTFFNYFPSKEAAVVHGPIELAEPDVAAFRTAEIAPYPEILRELVELLSRGLVVDAPARHEIQDVFAVARENPAVLAAMLEQLDRFQREVAAIVAERLGTRVEDDAANLVAALALTVLRTGFDRWAKSTVNDAHANPVSQIEFAANLLFTLFERG